LEFGKVGIVEGVAESCFERAHPFLENCKLGFLVFLKYLQQVYVEGMRTKRNGTRIVFAPESRKKSIDVSLMNA
jgi:hypothetical protein